MWRDNGSAVLGYMQSQPRAPLNANVSPQSGFVSLNLATCGAQRGALVPESSFPCAQGRESRDPGMRRVLGRPSAVLTRPLPSAALALQPSGQRSRGRRRARGAGGGWALAVSSITHDTPCCVDSTGVPRKLLNKPADPLNGTAGTSPGKRRWVCSGRLKLAILKSEWQRRRPAGRWSRGRSSSPGGGAPAGGCDTTPRRQAGCPPPAAAPPDCSVQD